MGGWVAESEGGREGVFYLKSQHLAEQLIFHEAIRQYHIGEISLHIRIFSPEPSLLAHTEK